MIRPLSLNSKSDFRAAIIHDPLVLDFKSPLQEAVNLMSGVCLCEISGPKQDLAHTSKLDKLGAAADLKIRSSCVIVLESNRVVGILTERDIVKIVAQKQPVERLLLEDVMSHPVVALNENDLSDTAAVLKLCQSSNIRHLPIVDDQNTLVGLVTYDSLRKHSSPLELLRVLSVEEVMTAEVVFAQPDVSLSHISQQMMHHRISSVVIVQNLVMPTDARRIPVGIITERDIVQCQAVALDLDKHQASSIMSSPVFTIQPTISLIEVQEIMDKHHIRRVVVTDSQEELRGIVTQTHILQSLNPNGLPDLTRTLIEKVLRLEAKNTELLQQQADELEKQVVERTTALTVQTEREKLVNQIATRIRNSLDLQTILDICVIEVRAFLNCDRVLIQQFQADWSGHIIAESVNQNWPSLLGMTTHDSCFPNKTSRLFESDHPIVVSNINTQRYAPCHLEFLKQHQVRAVLVLPIKVRGELWGLLIGHHCAPDHSDWQSSDSILLGEISVQLAIAIQQAQTHQLLQSELRNHQNTTISLRVSQQRYTNLLSTVPVGIFRSDINNKCLFVNNHWSQITGISQEAALGQYWYHSVHPDDQPTVLAAWMQYTQGNVKPFIFQIEFRILRPDQSERWVNAQCLSEWNDSGEQSAFIGTISDISDRKYAEQMLAESERRFRRAIEEAPFPIMIHAEDGAVIQLNRRWSELTGYQLSDIPTTLDWAQRAYAEKASMILETVIQQKYNLTSRLEEGEFTVKTASGDFLIWFFSTAPLGILPDGRKQVISIAADLTEKNKINLALQQSEEKLRFITENMSDLVCLHDLRGRITYVSPSCFSILGFKQSELINTNPFLLIYPGDLPKVRQKVKSVIQSCSQVSVTYRAQNRDGSHFWLETFIKPIIDEQGRVIHYETSSRDVSKRINALQQLQYDAYHDDLTGLPNRSRLIERLSIAINRCQRHPDYQFAVLYIDLDNFKLVNDSLGHHAGDELLVNVAHQLQVSTRETDLSARLGGDEFVIFLENFQDLHEVIYIAERILLGVKTPISIVKQEIFASASMGIVIGSSHYSHTEELLRDADIAMYRAKEQGRNQFALFDPEMHRQALDRLHIESDLRNALEKQELVLYYQPIINLQNQVIEGVEALVRWNHPTHGLLKPGAFIAIAEESGLIVAIGDWVLHQACIQWTAWKQQFSDLDCKVHVNLSVKQLKPHLILMLDNLLEAQLITPESLVLEVTESMLVQDFEKTRDLLEQIRARGVKISIDDFGSGYSSLSYLHQLPVDTFKIDSSFIRSFQPNSRHKVIAESIIALSDLLEIETIAEGIETMEQLEWLKSLGCEQGQGFLISRPRPPEEIAVLLSENVISL